MQLEILGSSTVSHPTPGSGPITVPVTLPAGIGRGVLVIIEAFLTQADYYIGAPVVTIGGANAFVSEVDAGSPMGFVWPRVHFASLDRLPAGNNDVVITWPHVWTAQIFALRGLGKITPFTDQTYQQVYPAPRPNLASTQWDTLITVACGNGDPAVQVNNTAGNTLLLTAATVPGNPPFNPSDIACGTNHALTYQRQGDALATVPGVVRTAPFLLGGLSAGGLPQRLSNYWSLTSFKLSPLAFNNNGSFVCDNRDRRIWAALEFANLVELTNIDLGQVPAKSTISGFATGALGQPLMQVFGPAFVTPSVNLWQGSRGERYVFCLTSSGMSVLRTLNNGASWVQLGSPWPAGLEHSAACGQLNGEVATAAIDGAGALKFRSSADSGATWSAAITVTTLSNTLTGGQRGPALISYLPNRGILVIYCPTVAQMFTSLDNGATWTPVTSPWPSQTYAAIGLGRNGLLYGVAQRYDSDNIELSYSSDGATWAAPRVIDTLSGPYPAPSQVLAGLYITESPSGGLYRIRPHSHAVSFDNGATWANFTVV